MISDGIHTRLIDFLEFEANGPFTLKDAYNACKVYTICCHTDCPEIKKNPNIADNRTLCPKRQACIDKDETNIRMQIRNYSDASRGDKQLLEKSMRIPGCYRKINKTRKKLDIVNAEPGVTVDFRFPLGLERVIRVVPKTLIAAAGDSGSGKSGLCLMTVIENLERHVVHYFANNQMTANRIKERLLEYKRIGSVNMSNFDAEEREDNFADVIYPDGINVIDYITVPSDRPSSIETELNAIVSKLTTGVCFAALQKKQSSKDKKGNDVENDLAVGGEWTFRVPSVYLALHKGSRSKGIPNRLKICKAKERTIRDVDPEGMVFKYKLRDGINFSIVEYPEDWPKEEVIEINLNKQDELEF